MNSSSMTNVICTPITIIISDDMSKRLEIELGLLVSEIKLRFM